MPVLPVQVRASLRERDRKSLMMVYYWLVVAFILGTVIGSFLNVCIARLPLEKSILWPGSRCGSCLQRIRWYDNLPLISYLWLSRPLPHLRRRFSMRYFVVELLTGLGFAGLFYVEVTRNIHGLADSARRKPGRRHWRLSAGMVERVGVSRPALLLS